MVQDWLEGMRQFRNGRNLCSSISVSKVGGGGIQHSGNRGVHHITVKITVFFFFVTIKYDNSNSLDFRKQITLYYLRHDIACQPTFTFLCVFGFFFC